MGLKDFFGSGQKEKEHFRIPKEITDLRTKIEAEARENYPSLVRYNEIKRAAGSVYASLNALIDNTLYATEAMKIKEDIDKKMESLTNKIHKNKQEGKKESSDDYVESNIDYIERKNMRNKAKTLFIYILEEIASFEKYCSEGALEKGITIESETADFYKHVLELNNDFFNKHGNDKEIQGIKLEVVSRMSVLNSLFNENKARFQENWSVANNIKASLKQILGDKRV